jgi:hypothetical protein
MRRVFITDAIYIFFNFNCLIALLTVRFRRKEVENVEIVGEAP